jgi:hypothetical protein
MEDVNQLVDKFAAYIGSDDPGYVFTIKLQLRDAIIDILEKRKIGLPKEPPLGLLMSMAIRYDHALGIPGYYDQQIFEGEGNCGHMKRLQSTLTTMSQLYEEVAGYGFYQPSKETIYASKVPEEIKNGE